MDDWMLYIMNLQRYMLKWFMEIESLPEKRCYVNPVAAASCSQTEFWPSYKKSKIYL